MNLEILWTLASLLLTIFILSYVFGDNMLFRISSYIFVGVAAGYVTLMVIYQVILPRLILPLIEGSSSERFLVLPPLVLGALLTKLFPRFSSLGNISMGYYEAGHMMYVHLPSLARLKTDLSGFIQAAT